MFLCLKAALQWGPTMHIDYPAVLKTGYPTAAFFSEHASFSVAQKQILSLQRTAVKSHV
jgi:hypothetical protein